MTLIHRNAEPFRYEGTKEIGCLLVHGFTGSPSELRLLGDYLAKQGYGVSAPLLPGHGTIPEDLADKTWPQWYSQVEQEYLELKKKYRHVIPVGLSMGGILSLYLAHHYPVPAVVSLCAPIYLGNRRAYLAPLIQLFNKYYPKPVTAEKWEDELARGHFYYHSTPVPALVSLLKLIRQVKAELPKLTQPVLVMQSWKDGTVNPKSGQYIYNHLGSNNKKLVWLEKSGHLITLGQERQQVFAEVGAFLEEVEHGIII